MSLTNRKVLVTGAGGFIWSHLVERLVREGCRVRALVHYNSGGRWGNLEYISPEVSKEVEIFPGDVTDPFSVQKAVDGSEMVFHLAALIAIPYSYVSPQSYVTTNVTGTLNVMEACRRCSVERVVHTSTSETYGTAVYTPIDENHPLRGQSPYSASKIGADKIAESYHCSFGLPIATLRPFNTYGPRQSARAVIPTIISQILAGKRELKLGSLVPVRDFCYVKDTVDGFVKISVSDKCVGDTVNVGFGKGITIGELANTIVKVIGRDVTISSDDLRVRPENSEVMELICNNGKALDLMGWEPRYGLKEGIFETIEYIRDNMHAYKTDIFNV
jgi:NAD dependent epimerase/dehydratase